MKPIHLATLPSSKFSCTYVINLERRQAQKSPAYLIIFFLAEPVCLVSVEKVAVLFPMKINSKKLPFHCAYISPCSTGKEKSTEL